MDCKLRFHQSADLTSVCRFGDLISGIISRVTERFVNGIHTHDEEVRSRIQLFENLLESKEGVCFTRRER